MTDTDKLELQEIIQTALQPVHDRLDTLAEENRAVHQAMFGLRGTTGIETDMRTIQRDVDQLKTFRTRVITLFAAVQATLLIIVQIIISWMKVNIK